MSSEGAKVHWSLGPDPAFHLAAAVAFVNFGSPNPCCQAQPNTLGKWRRRCCLMLLLVRLHQEYNLQVYE